MNDENNNPAGPRGWIFYDAQCALCVRWMQRARLLFASRGFVWQPLQSPDAAPRLGVVPEAFATRMHLLTHGGKVLYNADALAVLCRSVWWLWPMGVLISLPGLRALARRSYDWLAHHRYDIGGSCALPRRYPSARNWADGISIALCPLAAWLLTARQAPWLTMWAIAFALFAACKWLTWRTASRSEPGLHWKRTLGYWLAWPGMSAEAFLNHTSAAVVSAQVTWGMANMAIGAAAVWAIVPGLLSARPMAAGWTGMIGMILMLHFGFFEVVAWVWQKIGVAVPPLMHTPAASTSLAEFWGKRWNTGFHELARRHVFRPMRRRVSAPAAMAATFLVSGLIHECVISVPARGGYGLPTLYFMLQALGLLLERTAAARALGLGCGIRGWVFTMGLTILPVGLLFPPPFIHNVILPFLSALGAL